MNPKAVSKANIRLRVAQKTVAELELCKEYDSFCELWYVFLVACKNIYTLLKQGAKGSAQSMQWFGGKDRERREDPLLRYVTEARNDDEHGLEEGSQFVPHQVSVGVNKPGYCQSAHWSRVGTSSYAGKSLFHFSGFHPDMSEFRSLDGKPILVEETPAHVKLLPVHDRTGVAHAPPTSHLGAQMVLNGPLPVATLMVNYLAKLVGEAEGLNTP